MKQITGMIYASFFEPSGEPVFINRKPGRKSFYTEKLGNGRNIDVAAFKIEFPHSAMTKIHISIELRVSGGRSYKIEDLVLRIAETITFQE